MKYTISDIKEGDYIKVEFFSKNVYGERIDCEIREGVVTKDPRYQIRFIYGGENNKMFYIEPGFEDSYNILVIADKETDPEYFL